MQQETWKELKRWGKGNDEEDPKEEDEMKQVEEE